jgi:Flp pilus assembly pilin Flp
MTQQEAYVNNQQTNIPKLVADKRGLTTVEYIIVLGLIAVVGIAAWQQFGETLTGEIEAADGYISDVVQ